MRLFFTDESSVEGSEFRSYGLSIYGGLILDDRLFRELTSFINDLKSRKYSLPHALELKWRFETVWENMRRVGYVSKSITRKTHWSLFQSLKSDYDVIKSEILDRVAQSEAKLVVAVRPNTLLRTSREKAVMYAVDSVARKFEKVLISDGDEYGIMLADELPAFGRVGVIDYEYILDLCCRGSSLSGPFDRLVNIVPTINSHLSPIHQINDIVLGSFQYYMIEFMRSLRSPEHNRDQAIRLFGRVVGNFYRSTVGAYTINNGLLLYPPKISRKSTPAGIFLDKLEAQLKVDFEIS